MATSPNAPSAPTSSSTEEAASGASTKSNFGVNASEKLLDLRSLATEFVEAGYITQRQAEDVVIAPRTSKEQGQHPMEILASREFENLQKLSSPFDLEVMTQWLADNSRQPYQRIDPLKINVNACTEVMSYAFAQRHNILALEVTDDEVVITSGQPFMYQWESMLTQTLRGRRIKRVVSSPADINRYMLEFYTMARSVSQAEDSGLEVSGIGNFGYTAMFRSSNATHSLGKGFETARLRRKRGSHRASAINTTTVKRKIQGFMQCRLTANKPVNQRCCYCEGKFTAQLI